jgi:hypothetical protein
MRKLLLASAAMLGATGVAMAQAPSPYAPTQGMMMMPGNPAPPSSAFDAMNAEGSPGTYIGAAGYNKLAVPAPGTIVIHLGGKVEVDMVAQWSTNNQVTTSGGIPAGKANTFAFGSFMRLYPGVDGMATNGLRYGASVEFRENFPGSSAQATPALSSAPSGSAYSSGQTVFVRRAFTYLASDYVGIVRFGNGDGVIGLFDNCIFSSQCWDAGAGNFNGGPLQGVGVTGATAIPFAWLAQAGAEYGNTKVAYLSPQFFGLDVGVQFAPGMNNGNSGCTTAGITQTAIAAAGTQDCASLTSGADPTRWYNQVGVGGRYQGAFGPLSIGAYAFYEAASKDVAYAAPVSFARGGAGNQFDNLSFVSAAAYASVDTGMGKVTYSVDYIGGALNGQLAMRPTGGAPEHAVVSGLLYTNGPITLGAEAGLVESQGSNSLTSVSQRHEFEVAFGGNYNLAPGLYLVGEYMYAYRHQGGFDFLSGANGAGSTGAGTAGYHAGLTRDAHGQGILFSTVVNW